MTQPAESIPPTGPPRRLPAFLTEGARQHWRAIADARELDARWVPGRQGTGYEKLDLRVALEGGALKVERSFVEGGRVVLSVECVFGPAGA